MNLALGYADINAEQSFGLYVGCVTLSMILCFIFQETLFLSSMCWFT